MITLALAQMIYFFYLQTPFTHGEDGIQAVPRGTLFGVLDLSNSRWRCTTSCSPSSSPGSCSSTASIHSPFGQVLKAIRENEPRAISLGYDADRYKLLAFVLSATLAGLAGATKAIVFQLASLTDVHWTMSGEVVLMTLLGGMGTIFGPVVGAFVIIALENYLAGFGAVGDGHHRRDLRRLRARVPPRHRGRARRMVGQGARLIRLLSVGAAAWRRGVAVRATACLVVEAAAATASRMDTTSCAPATAACASSARSTTAGVPARSSSGRHRDRAPPTSRTTRIVRNGRSRPGTRRRHAARAAASIRVGLAARRARRHDARLVSRRPSSLGDGIPPRIASLERSAGRDRTGTRLNEPAARDAAERDAAVAETQLRRARNARFADHLPHCD